MENNLRNKISATLKELSKIGFAGMIEKEWIASMFQTQYMSNTDETSGELKKRVLEELAVIKNDKVLKESYTFALNLNNSINEKELRPQLFEQVHESLKECFTSCDKRIESISFQYNYEPQFSCLCWSNGEYEIHEVDKYINRGSVIHCIEGVVNFEKWIQPIEIFEENESFMDFYMDDYVQLRKVYYWNIYANIIDAIKTFNQKYVATYGQKLTDIYYYANEFDCESTFLMQS